MKVLESAPYRYDRGIKILTLGKISKAYDRLVENIGENDEVLDIGCGTGMLSFRAALKGALVTGIDINPEMLEIAKIRTSNSDLEKNIKFIEIGVAELDVFEKNTFDVVMSGLCFSELSQDELSYALNLNSSILKPNGLLLVADEIKSKNILKRIINFIIRIPLVVITYILTQTTSKAIANLEEKITKEHFVIKSVKKNRLENFIELVAVNRKAEVK